MLSVNVFICPRPTCYFISHNSISNFVIFSQKPILSTPAHPSNLFDSFSYPLPTLTLLHISSLLVSRHSKTFPLQDLCSCCSIWPGTSTCYLYSYSLTSFCCLLKCHLVREACFSNLTELSSNNLFVITLCSITCFIFLFSAHLHLAYYLFICLLSAFPC